MTELDDLAEAVAAAVHTDGSSAREVVMSAAEALATDFDSPVLRDLAGQPPNSAWSDIRSLAADALEELSDASWLSQPGRVAIGAVRYSARLWLAGENARGRLFGEIRGAFLYETPQVGAELLSLAYEEWELDTDYPEWLEVIEEKLEALPGVAETFLAATAEWKTVDFALVPPPVPEPVQAPTLQPTGDGDFGMKNRAEPRRSRLPGWFFMLKRARSRAGGR